MPRGKESTAEQIIGKPREAEVLAREVFNTLLGAKVLIERWRKAYNTVRPNGSRGSGPRPQSRAARARLLRLRLSKRTGANHWQGNPDDRMGSISGARSVPPNGNRYVPFSVYRFRPVRMTLPTVGRFRDALVFRTKPQVGATGLEPATS